MVPLDRSIHRSACTFMYVHMDPPHPSTTETTEMLAAIVQSRWEDFLDEATELEAQALDDVAEEEFTAAEGMYVCMRAGFFYLCGWGGGGFRRCVVGVGLG